MSTSHITFFGSCWDDALSGGIRSLPEHEYQISIRANVAKQTTRIYIIAFETSGEVIERRHIHTMRPRTLIPPLVFLAGRDWDKFSVAFLIEPKDKTWNLDVKRLKISSRKCCDEYSATSVLPVQKRPQACDGSEISTEKLREMRIHHSRKKKYNPSDYEMLLGNYLDKYESLTLKEYTQATKLNGRNILLMRHDVDHDFETAIAMATWEHDRGIKATYCFLHTAWYWGELAQGEYLHYRNLTEFGNKIIQLGHEVNMHNNFVTLALTTGLDPKEMMKKELSYMNSNDWNVTGSSLHGDKMCSEHNYNNAEIFKEAVKPERGGPREIVGPAGKVQLGSLSYDEVGLEYEAYDIARDYYITDSGGRLRCMKNAPGRRSFARTNDSSGQVVGILTHPVWWDFSKYNS